MSLKTETAGIHFYGQIAFTITSDNQMLLHRVDADQLDVVYIAVAADTLHPGLV